MQVSIYNSFQLDPVRNYNSNFEIKRIYLSIILAEIFKAYNLTDRKLDLFFVDNQFSNHLCLDLKELKSILNDKFDEINLYSDNPLDCRTGEFKIIRSEVVFEEDQNFVASTRKSKLECSAPTYKFGVCIQRPDQHRLSLLVGLADLNELDLFSKIGFDKHTLNVIDYWRQSCGDQVLREHNLSYGQFCDKLENFTRSDLTDFMNPCVDGHSLNNIAHNQTCLNYCLDIACESTVGDEIFIPSEKVLRPMMLKQPFIVYSSQYFYKNLHKLGFKTFDSLWDESWDKFDQYWMFEKTKHIVNTVKDINGRYTIDQLLEYTKEIREHNYQRCVELYTNTDEWDNAMQGIVNG
jgi:hypothetical protein